MSTADIVVVDLVNLHGADIEVVAGRIHGGLIGDLVRRVDRLRQIGVFGRWCFLCDSARVTTVRGTISWQPLCRTHGLSGE